MAYPVSIKTLIAKIHIAKSQLGLDDELYRAILKDATSKESCKSMNFAELMMVLHAMEKRGFKAKAPTNKGTESTKRLSKPSGQTHYSRSGQDKVVAIWITMHRQGFIEDGSETALDKFVRNQTGKMGMFSVSSVRFLNPQQSSKIIEVLKKWHIRAIKKDFKQSGVCYGPTPLPYVDLVNYFNSVTPSRDSNREVDIALSQEISQ